MKIATVTWISYSNYGTYLQGYALQKFIEQLGHENVIISDYKILKEFHSGKIEHLQVQQENKMKYEEESLNKRIERFFLNPRRIPRIILSRINNEKYQQPYVDSRIAFEKFRQNDIKVLEIESYEELNKLNKEFDIFICGSDQIWSTFDKNFNSYYFLDFVTKKKVAYAPSIGTDKISESKAQIIKKLLSDFTALSVREDISAKQLSAITGQNVSWVIDPTLLFDKKFWGEFTVNIPMQRMKYVLCYFLENKKWYFEYTKKLAKKLHLHIILIPCRYEYVSNEYVTKDGVGPKEFVALFQNATYILTDSYHGCIFSLIFEKEFQYLLRFDYNDQYSQNIRIQSLFGMLQLNDRIIAENHVLYEKSKIDYRRINRILSVFREYSQNYLRNNL